MLDADQNKIEQVRDKKEEWLKSIGVESTSIGLDSGGRVCLRLWCDQVTPELRTTISSDSDLCGIPVEFDEGTDFVTQ